MNMKTRFNFGGTVEQNAIGVGFWTRRDFQQRDDDLRVQLNEQTATRLNIITKKLYGKDNLVWLLLQYNNILDPAEELVPGKIIRMPHPSRIV